MPTYENMYYYLEHSIREALQDLEQQNFGAAKKTLTQAREVTEKMRRVIVGKNDVYECFRNPYDFIERYLSGGCQKSQGSCARPALRCAAQPGYLC